MIITTLHFIFYTHQHQKDLGSSPVWPNTQEKSLIQESRWWLPSGVLTFASISDYTTLLLFDTYKRHKFIVKNRVILSWSRVLKNKQTIYTLPESCQSFWRGVCLYHIYINKIWLIQLNFFLGSNSKGMITENIKRCDNHLLHKWPTMRSL